MLATVDMGHTVSENSFSTEVEDEVASMCASSSKIEVSGNVILGYNSPSRVEV